MTNRNTVGGGPDGDGLAVLAEAAVAGDRSAANDLLRALEPEITRYCRARIGRAGGTYATADDVAQEALLGVFQALSGYSDKGAPFRALVFRIARNKVFDYYRKTSRERDVQLDETPDLPEQRPGPESLTLRNERGAELGGLLSGLSDYQREVLALRVAVGYSAEETARMLSTSPGAVRVSQTRALAILRKKVNSRESEL